MSANRESYPGDAKNSLASQSYPGVDEKWGATSISTTQHSLAAVNSPSYPAQENSAPTTLEIVILGYLNSSSTLTHLPSSTTLSFADTIPTITL